MLDVVISGGRLIDGTGRSIQQADVAVAGDRIADIQPFIPEESAKKVIRADGRFVCPGFIDVHSHSDTYVLLEPSAASKVFQGITTEVIGNCGASAAPRHGNARLPSDWETFEYPGCWNSMAEYRRIVESVSPGINVAALVGHNILRAGVIGYEGRTASAEELALMIERLEVSMEAGARGLSSGLIYPPGMYATEQEIHALATAVARQNGIYASHMRSEGRNLLESLSETIRVARSTGVRLQVSHLKTSGKANWHLIETAIEMLESVQCEGIQVAADRYPYTASCTELDVILPVWATEGGREAELHRLRDNQTRARIRQEILESRDPDSWSSITIGSTTRQNCRFRGLLLTEVSAALSLDPIDAALHLIETDQLSTTAFFHGMSEENMWRILSLPWVMLGTDASLRAPWGPLSQDFPHPRAYGSFTLFLKASLEGRTVPVTEAVRKMTSLPAAQFNLEDRGVIRRGAKADIAILDPAHLRAPASYGSPHQLSEGVTELLVNGVVQIQNGTLTGSRGGRWL